MKATTVFGQIYTSKAVIGLMCLYILKIFSPENCITNIFFAAKIKSLYKMGMFLNVLLFAYCSVLFLGAYRDKDGYYWITGRIDDLMNVSGHLLSTAQVESALVEHSSISEAAVVGFPHEVKGTGIYCFVTPKNVCSVYSS